MFQSVAPSQTPSDLELYKHQIASPLTTIICSLEQHFLDFLNQNHPTAFHLKRALEAAKEISSTINSRDHHYDLTTTEKNLKSFEVASVLTQICQQFQKPYPVNIDLNLNSIIERRIFGNPDSFKTVVTHLLNNAAESYPCHQLDKTISVWSHPHQGGLIIAISDCGQGISEDQLDKIFEADFSTKKRRGGLGLWEVKKILNDDFDAEIKIFSKPNRGSTIIIFL